MNFNPNEYTGDEFKFESFTLETVKKILSDEKLINMKMKM